MTVLPVEEYLQRTARLHESMEKLGRYEDYFNSFFEAFNSANQASVTFKVFSHIEKRCLLTLGSKQELHSSINTDIAGLGKITPKIPSTRWQRHLEMYARSRK